MPSAALSGTIDGALESAVRDTGGQTIIVTLTDDTWVAAGATFNAERQGIIDALAGFPSGDFETEVAINLVVGDVVRTSDTVVTITLGAPSPAYGISADETVVINIPHSALVVAEAPLVSTTQVVITAEQGDAMMSAAAGKFQKFLQSWPRKFIFDGQVINVRSPRELQLIAKAHQDRQTNVDQTGE